VVSDVVDTSTVNGVVVAGFVTFVMLTLTASPAAMLWPLNSEHRIVCPMGLEQLPTLIDVVVSRTDDVVNVVRLGPAGNARMTWLPAALLSPPVADVMKATVYTAVAPGVLVLNARVGWLIGFFATTLYGAELTPGVSDVVETDSVSAGDGVGGLVTPLMVTLTASPAATLWPLNSEHLIVCPTALEQLPTLVFVVTSRTFEVKYVVRSVPAGNVSEI
jgi:hypothetical protein